MSLGAGELLISMPAGKVNSDGVSSSVTEQGNVVVYKRTDIGSYTISKLITDNTPIPPTVQNFFGNSVSIKNGNYIIGIPGKDLNGINNTGSVSFGYID